MARRAQARPQYLGGAGAGVMQGAGPQGGSYRWVTHWVTQGSFGGTSMNPPSASPEVAHECGGLARAPGQPQGGELRTEWVSAQ